MAPSNHSRRARCALALTFVCVLFADARAAHAGINVWTSNGPEGEDVRALAIDPASPTTLYAGSLFTTSWLPGGVFKSTDGGGAWSTLNTGLTNLNVNALVIDPIEPRRVYAGTGGGVFAIEQVQVVGTGTPASCTETALDAALIGGGLVTFDCGPDPVTITVTSEKAIRTDTTIDGEGLITLSGGGAVRIFRVVASAALALRNLTIARGGDGILNDGGALTLTNCTLSGNSASGITNSGGTATLTNCTLSGNSASGINNYDYGALTLTNCTLSGNSASGINNDRGTATLTNCTLSGNGGAIVNHVCVPDEHNDCGPPNSVTLTNTIIVDSAGRSCIGRIIDAGYNLQFPDTSCGETIPSLDPKLDPAGLQDNGGPTETIALLADSPAIDAGDSEVCANQPVNGVDQRGYLRPGEGATNCSIGAYEANAIPPEACTGDCDGNGIVAINELIVGVNIVLDLQPLNACPVFAHSEGRVDIAQLIKGVNNAMSGCGLKQ